MLTERQLALLRASSRSNRVATAISLAGVTQMTVAAAIGVTQVLASSRICGILEFSRPQDVVVLAASSDQQRARVLASVKARRFAPPPLSRGLRP